MRADSRFPGRAGRLAMALVLACSVLIPALAADEAAAGGGGNPVVEIHTNVGQIVVELWPEQAPRTVANFLKYADEGFYSGTIFHRVIGGFMIQGGGFTEDMKKKDTHPPIPLEAGAPNEQYTLAMARTGDPNSATAQFFINLVNNGFLNPAPGKAGYAVFGKVIEGEGVVEQIGRVQTRVLGGMKDVPATPVIIEKVVVR